MAITFSPNIASMSADDKAREYNRLRSQGYSDAAIRQAVDAQFGAQPESDWSYLQGLAQRQNTSPQELANFQALDPQAKAQVYLQGLGSGQTDEQLRYKATGLFGYQNDTDWNNLKTYAQELSPQQKAQVYNLGLSTGLTDAQIRANIDKNLGAQTNEDWTYLTNLANQQRGPQVAAPMPPSGPSYVPPPPAAPPPPPPPPPAVTVAANPVANNPAFAPVALSNPFVYTPNPYLGEMADSIRQQVSDNLQRNILPSIGSAAVAAGGYGGSRQGVVEANALKDANTGLSSALSNLYGQDYSNAMNRNLQRYQADQNYNLGVGNMGLGYVNSAQNYNLGLGNLGLGFQNSAQQFALGAGGLANQRYGQDQNFALGVGGLANQRYGQDQNFALGVGNLGVAQQNAGTNQYQAQTQRDLGYGNLGLGYYNAANNYALGAGGLANQRYGQDQNFALGVGGLANQRYGQDQNFALGVGNLGLGFYNAGNNYDVALGNLGLGYQNSLQNFYTNQRGQDLQATQLGANLVQQGNTGMQQQGQGIYNLGLAQQQAPWNVVGNYTNTVSPFTGFGNTTNSTPGNAGAGALGGALIGAQLYNIFNKP